MNRIKVLRFDTRLFGFKVARFTGKRLDVEGAKRLVKECKDKGPGRTGGFIPDYV